MILLNPTLFVGIDVSKSSNQVYAMTFDQKKLLSTSIPNTQDGAEIMERKFLDLLDKNALSKITIVLESTGVYSAHIATFLSASKYLAVFDVKGTNKERTIPTNIDVFFEGNKTLFKTEQNRLINTRPHIINFITPHILKQFIILKTNHLALRIDKQD